MIKINNSRRGDSYTHSPHVILWRLVSNYGNYDLVFYENFMSTETFTNVLPVL